MTPGTETSRPRREFPDLEEVTLVARGIATAVAPEGGITDVQADLLEAIASALAGQEVDYRDLEPLEPEALATALADRDENYRQRIVHHMVLGELVLRPLPTEVAMRVATYAQALGIDDKFVRVARRYAQGAFGLAWMDLRRSGFTEHWENSETDQLHTEVELADPLEPAEVDTQLEAEWQSFAEYPEGTLGRGVSDMYTGRGFPLPGTAEGASAYLAQHDFVHVIADYGTNLRGELEVFAFIGRADPDPRGFAWLATLVGLFETGYVADAGFFQSDTRERNIQAPGMHHRLADALLRGRSVCDVHGSDLLCVDYHELAAKPVEEVREILGVTDKSAGALDSGSVGLFDLEGMSEHQKRVMAALAKKSKDNV
jgi:hypothetical protein